MSLTSLKRLYGNPSDGRGHLSRAWYDANVIQLVLPYPMRLAWNKAQVVKTTQVHRRVAPELEAALRDVWAHARMLMKQKHGYNQTTKFYDKVTLEYLQANGLDLFGGVFNYRKIVGGNELSAHAFAAAIDLDPKHNALGKVGKMPGWVVAIFKRHGAKWGGDFRRKDYMHFEWS